MFEYLKFLESDYDPSTVIAGTYDLPLVGLSVFIAMLASYGALRHSNRAASLSSNRDRLIWYLASALTMGGGVWAMHFIGMMAFRLPVAMDYHAGITVASTIPAILGGGLALFLVSRAAPSPATIAGAGLAMGAGIGAMHYSGMAAMEMAVETYYSPVLFAASVAMAVALATVALFSLIAIPRYTRLSPGLAAVISAIVMGMATSGMHYTAMEAAYFIRVDTIAFELRGDGHGAHDQHFVMMIALGALLLVPLGVITNTVFQQKELAARLAHEVEKREQATDTLQFLYDLIATANKAPDFVVAFRECLEKLSARAGWDGGRAYLCVDGRADVIVATGRLLEEDDAWGQNRMARIFVEKNRTQWNSGVTSTDEPVMVMPPRAEDERDYAPTIIVIAIATGRELGALLEFVTDNDRPLDDDMKLMLPALCMQLGEVVAQKNILHKIRNSESTLRATKVELEDAVKELEFQKFALDQHAIVTASDVDGTITYANDRCTEMSGYSLDELIGQNHRLFKSDYHPPAFYADMWKTISRGEVWNGEVQNRKKSGDPYWIDCTIVPFVDDNGKPFQYISIRTDITERKRAEKEMVRAKEHAERASKAKSDFLATMSHEIRTPMNGVIGMIDLMSQTRMSGDQKQMLDTVRSSSYALLHIINDILDFSKIEAGKLEIENTVMCLPDLVENVAASFVPNVDTKDLRLDVHVEPGMCSWVMGDQVRIRQILFNFVGNAVKFTESRDGRKGRVLVSLSPAPHHADGRAMARIAIADNGIGMSDEELAKLFQPFTQAEASTTRRFGGTGLGLSICQQLVEMMDGAIDVASEPGQGTTVTVTLPFQTVDVRTEDQGGADLSGLRVFLAHEDDTVRGIARDYLNGFGAEVAVAVDPNDPRGADAGALSGADVAVVSDACAQAVRAVAGDAAGQDGEDGARFVVLTMGRAIRKNMIGSDVMYVDAAPLLSGPFRRAVGAAAGRASPDVDADLPTATPEQPRDRMTAEEAETAGRLILVAEDNAINRAVIGRQLDTLGYPHEMAFDGKQGLDAWRTGRFGLLLTDCHMPEMDGYELTGAIRADEDGTGNRAPIVAITANALVGERERCLEAGMDDFIAKPVELRKLGKLLAKWVPGGAPAPAAKDAMDESPAAAEPAPESADALAET